jgi:hypothetical protein
MKMTKIKIQIIGKEEVVVKEAREGQWVDPWAEAKVEAVTEMMK